MTDQSVGITGSEGAVAEAMAPDSGRSLAARTAAGTAVATVLALVLRAVAIGTEPGLAALAPFGVMEIVSSAVFAGAGAALAYAGATRFTDQPIRTFLAAAVTVFVLSLAAVVTAAPDLGVGTTGQLWLVGLHVVVAVPLTLAVARLIPQRR